MRQGCSNHVYALRFRQIWPLLLEAQEDHGLPLASQVQPWQCYAIFGLEASTQS